MDSGGGPYIFGRPTAEASFKILALDTVEAKEVLEDLDGCLGVNGFGISNYAIDIEDKAVKCRHIFDYRRLSEFLQGNCSSMFGLFWRGYLV